MPQQSPVAIITGAGSGIGQAAAVALARAGHAVLLAGRREDRLRHTAAMLPAGANGSAVIFPADVGRASNAAAMIDLAVERFGRLDVLLNNAGRAPRMPIGQHTPATIDEAYRINALAPAYAIARAWPIFTRQLRGCIVNISSMASIDPLAGFFAYAASKAAVNLMALSCAAEGAPFNIRAFAIAPGAVETEMFRNLFTPEQFPPERCLAPEDVARVIVECVRGERDAENGRVIPLQRE